MTTTTMTNERDEAVADDAAMDDAAHRGASAGVPIDDADADIDDDDDGYRWRKYGEKVCFKNSADKVCERRSYYKCTMCAGCPARKRVSVDARGRRRAWTQGAHRHDDEDAPQNVVPVKKRKLVAVAAKQQQQQQQHHHHCPALDVSVPVK